MIAVVSSTLCPSTLPYNAGAGTCSSPDIRLRQTVETVSSLVQLGFPSIFIADNAPTAPADGTREQLLPAQIRHFPHFPYRNKGIAEARLLLALCDHLPADVPVLKVSGRYRLSLNLCHELRGQAFAGLFIPGRLGLEQISTRAYAVCDTSFLRRFLHGSLEEIYASPWRICGPRSLLGVLSQHLGKKSHPIDYSDPPAGIEICAARWLIKNHVAARRLPRIGVTGVIGSRKDNLIDE